MILWALRLSTLVTVGLALAMLWASPVTRLYVQNTGADLALALDRVLGEEFGQAWLDQTLTEALEQVPTNWVLAESALELGAQRDLRPSQEAATLLATATERDKNTLGQMSNCVACAAGDESCRLGDGLVCALGVELTPIGDARVLWNEGHAYANGEEVDDLSVALAGVGLAATVAIVASAGSSAPVKGGVAILRVARKAGSLSPALTARLTRLGSTLVNWQKLPRTPRAMLNKGAFQDALNPRVLAESTALVGDLDRIRRAVPAAGALALLPYIDNGQDARRVARLAEAAGAKSVAVMHRLGKARAMRLTAKLSRTGRTLVGLAAAIAAQVLALAAVLAQAVLSGVLRRFIR